MCCVGEMVTKVRLRFEIVSSNPTDRAHTYYTWNSCDLWASWLFLNFFLYSLGTKPFSMGCFGRYRWAVWYTKEGLLTHTNRQFSSCGKTWWWNGIMMRNYSAWQEGDISWGPWWRSNTATSRRILQLTKTILHMQHAIVNVSYWSTQDTLAQVARTTPSFFVCGAVSRLLYTVIPRRKEKRTTHKWTTCSFFPNYHDGPWLAYI